MARWTLAEGEVVTSFDRPARALRASYITLVVAATVPPCAAAGTALAADARPMEETLVTGVRQQTAWEMPASVAVIDSDDIASAPVNDLAGLLAREANVNLRSLYGSPKFSSVDIRGLGDTAVSNVIVMLDGVRLNSVDLSGADFAAIDLAQIERVEIIRGGGGVRYGNGAVGGVINIITQRARAAPRASAEVRYGSFDTWNAAAALQGGFGGVSADLRAAGHDSDGFRDNSALATRDLGADLRFERWQALQFGLRASYHYDRFELPGPISLEEYRRSDQARRRAASPDDGGGTEDRRYRADAKLDLGRFGTLDSNANLRLRDSEFVIGFTPLLTVGDQRDTVEETARTYEFNYSLPFELLGAGHYFNAGASRYSADYLRRDNGSNLPDRSAARVGAVVNDAFYASLDLGLPGDLRLSAGWRGDSFAVERRDERLRQQCRTRVVQGGAARGAAIPAGLVPGAGQSITVQVPVEVPILVELVPGSGTLVEVGTTTVEVPITLGPERFTRVQLASGAPIEVSLECDNRLEIVPGQRERWRNAAWEIGLVWAPRPELSVYARYSHSFRNPNVDELVLASSDLRPQRGQHWDAGVRYRAGPIELSAAVFHFGIDDEIFFGFDVESGENVNFNLRDRTRRTGFEFEGRVNPLPRVSLFANVGYVAARLGDGGTRIPLVPAWTVTTGGELELSEHAQLAVSARHVSDRVDGNDFSNDRFERLDDYQVVDLKLRYRLPRVELSFGLNNLLDQTYATSGYSNTRYPMPGRSAFLGLRMDI